MSSKAIASVVGIIIVVAGAWYLWSRSANTSSPVTTEMQSQTENSAGTQTANSNTSDASMQEDAASIDTQLQAASTDNTSAQSFNDTQVAQTE